MLRATIKHGDVSRETIAWQRERDAIARAVESARKELCLKRVYRAIDCVTACWQK